MEKDKIVVIAGPTAAGKSALAVELAIEFNGEIISADSMQVYKHMDIGTAKPTLQERGGVPHHLIDIAEPSENYTAARYRADAMEKIREIRARGRAVFIAGGTGLYIKALTAGLFIGPGSDGSVRERLREECLKGGALRLYERLKSVDPAASERIHPNNTVRVIRALEVYELSKRPISELQREHGFNDSTFDCLKIGITMDRDRLYGAIEERVERMMEAGLLDEVRGLREMGFGWDLKPMRGLGYKEMSMALCGERSLSDAVELLKKNTRHYAKRQITWFTKDPGIRWFSPEEKKGIPGLVRGHLK